MLQHEITPFADAHIQKTRDARNGLEAMLTTSRLALTTNQIEALTDAINAFGSNINALTRFKLCAEDEWKQKKRYEKYAKEHGYPFS